MRPLLLFTAVLILCAPLAANAVTTPLLNTSVVPYDASQTTQSGAMGVTISYNNTLSKPTSLVFYLSVANSAGQIVFFVFQSISSCTPGYPCVYFQGLSNSGLAHGNYTASFFASNAQGVVLSTVTRINVTL